MRGEQGGHPAGRPSKEPHHVCGDHVCVMLQLCCFDPSQVHWLAEGQRQASEGIQPAAPQLQRPAGASSHWANLKHSFPASSLPPTQRLGHFFACCIIHFVKGLALLCECINACARPRCSGCCGYSQFVVEQQRVANGAEEQEREGIHGGGKHTKTEGQGAAAGWARKRNHALYSAPCCWRRCTMAPARSAGSSRSPSGSSCTTHCCPGHHCCASSPPAAGCGAGASASAPASKSCFCTVGAFCFGADCCAAAVSCVAAAGRLASNRRAPVAPPVRLVPLVKRPTKKSPVPNSQGGSARSPSGE